MDTDHGNHGLLRWPARLLGPPPGLKELHLVAWGLFAALLIVPLCVSFWIQARSGPGSIRRLHSDFVYFYGDGQLVNQYPAARLYEYPLQLETFNRLYTLSDRTYGPSPYPPFVAQFFSLFARLSFESAYLAWMATSLALYLAGVATVASRTFPHDRLRISLAFCYALSYYPFIFDTLVNGQISSVAFCAVAVAVHQERRSSSFLSGLALSLLVYKPTLLLLIVPMLLVTRRFRALAGFLTGAAALVAAATCFAGWQIWPIYLRFLANFTGMTGSNGRSALALWEYVDLRALTYAIPGGRSHAGLALVLAAALAVAVSLGILLWRSGRCTGEARSLAWAATLTWTVVLNVYAPVYDSILVVLALLLTLGASTAGIEERTVPRTLLLAAAIFAASWCTEGIAKAHGIQILTVLLAGLGIWQLHLLRISIRTEPAQTPAPQVV